MTPDDAQAVLDRLFRDLRVAASRGYVVIHSGEAENYLQVLTEVDAAAGDRSVCR